MVYTHLLQTDTNHDRKNILKHIRDKYDQDSVSKDPTNLDAKSPELINRSDRINYDNVDNDDDQSIDNAQGNNNNTFEVNIDYEEEVSIIDASFSPVQLTLDGHNFPNFGNDVSYTYFG